MLQTNNVLYSNMDKHICEGQNNLGKPNWQIDVLIKVSAQFL